jgi:glycosyltransferase involved in cell wall biosynthesis
MPLKPKEKNSLGLSKCDRPISRHAAGASWLLLPEVLYRSKAKRIIRFARNRGMRVAAIFHDAIPVSHPELVRPEAAKYHAEYMEALCSGDIVIAVSHSVAEEFRRFVKERKLPLPSIHVCSHAGELLGQSRWPAKSRATAGSVSILCVSTFEARKNHSTLLEAFVQANSSLQCPNLFLHLVGDRYKNANSLARQVQAGVRGNPNTAWHGSVTNDALASLYKECAFTVYPSLMEGFGLPILESLWHGRPCICANFGAMAETARGGGCLTVDVREADKLAEAMVSLSTRADLHEKLAAEISNRLIKSWAEYAAEICGVLESAFERGSQ